MLHIRLPNFRMTVFESCWVKKKYYINIRPIINSYAVQRILTFQYTVDTVLNQFLWSTFKLSLISGTHFALLRFLLGRPGVRIRQIYQPLTTSCGGLKNNVFYHQKSQTREELLQQITECADFIRGKDEMIRKAGNSLWDASNCAYRMVIIL